MWILHAKSSSTTSIWYKEGNVLFNDTLNIFYLHVYERKEGNVLLIDALNIFYLQLYGVKTYGKGPLK